jgi:hypothetical protein
MADVVRAAISIGNLDISTAVNVPQLTGAVAGEAIPAGNFVYQTSDGKLHNTVGGALATGQPVCLGVVARTVAAGQPCTVLGNGTRIRYTDPGVLTPGVRYYLSAVTNGALGTAASTGDVPGCAIAVTDQDIMVTTAVAL